MYDLKIYIYKVKNKFGGVIYIDVYLYYQNGTLCRLAEAVGAEITVNFKNETECIHSNLSKSIAEPCCTGFARWLRRQNLRPLNLYPKPIKTGCMKILIAPGRAALQ